MLYNHDSKNLLLKNYFIKKRIKLNLNIQNLISLLLLGNNLFFLIVNSNLNVKQYIKLPGKIFFFKHNDFIYIYNLFPDNKSLFYSFYHGFCKFLNNYDKMVAKKIFLKGLGFKINIFEKENYYLLNFKLGYSHYVEMKVSKENVLVFLKKNMITLKSTDFAFIGNLGKNIKNLKSPNVYNGKGFWYKKEKIVYKIFKKK